MLVNLGIFFRLSSFTLQDFVNEFLGSEAVFEWVYLLICLLGWLGHELFYCLLVGLIKFGAEYFQSTYFPSSFW